MRAVEHDLHRDERGCQCRPPTTAEPDEHDSENAGTLPARVRQAICALDWVTDARVRLREHGHVVIGDAMVVPRDEARLLERIADAQHAVTAVDWRLHAITIMPVSTLDDRTRQPA